MLVYKIKYIMAKLTNPNDTTKHKIFRYLINSNI